MSEIRFDRIHNTHVIIAPERLHRPNLFKSKFSSTAKSICPFCEGKESFTPPEIFAIRENEANFSGWKTRVVPNLYKAVQIEEEQGSKREGLFESVNGFGAHEILIDSPCHMCGMAELEKEGIENWLRTIIIRKDDLAKDKRLIHLSVFKNSGQNAGATQEHPHTQLIALPILPEEEILFLKRNMDYYNVHGRGIVEDVVKNEKIAEVRVLDEIGVFLAYCPYASAFSFEVIIAPTKNFASLCECSRSELSDLSLLIQKVFEMLNKQLNSFDYNITFHFAPLNSNFEDEYYMSDLGENFTFYIRITPRIYTLGGFETSTSMAMNSVTPEEAARLLKGDEN